MYDPRREEEILRFWNERKIFEKSLEKTKDGMPFVFYDGPPFATGLPHFGHALPTTIKDIIPRYQTMKGRYVPRIWGWDCHGLPIENLVEKKLGLKNKKEIEEYGVEKFNIEARNSVLNFADEWKKIIPRLGRWVDMDNDYRTMDPTFTESVWWSFKSFYDKDLAYEGFKSMHLCPHCETVLSNFEVGQGYKDITDISVTTEFELIDKPKTYVLVWTTTPWTLPGNVALAVNPEVEYLEVEGLMEGNTYIVDKDRVKEVFGEKYKIIDQFLGKKLIGKAYKPLFDYYSSQADLPNKGNGWKIYGADFVTTTDGTGIVHIAPAFGEDDLNLGNKEKLPFVQHVGTDGKFKTEVREFAGMSVKPKSDEPNGHQKADVEIIKHLAGKDLLFAKEKLVHPYPHCWRCETPLLNYAASSWFIKVSAFRDQLVESNTEIRWNPEHVGTGRFGKWLENARDWAISRSRYWGAPLPVWKSEDGKEIEIIGSLQELKSKIKRNNYIALRHAEAEHNVMEIVSSSLERQDHLTDNGRKELKRMVKEIKKEKIDVIYISPLIRSKETAELIVKEMNFKGEVIEDRRITEQDFGDLDGASLEKYIEYYKEYQGKEGRLTKSLPNGENLLEIRKRVNDFLYDIDQKHQGKNILIITHDAIIKMLEAISFGGTVEDLLSKWSQFYFIVITGEMRRIDFSPLPQNELGELDLHRPYIDLITWKSKNGAEMKRIKDVFDTWYDSGSMPFASIHYPFKNKKEFESGLYFPADFIAEGIEQTRGWFYSLLVLNIGLFNRAPYKQVVVNGTILAEDGRKMSKSLNNYPPLVPIIEKYGADSLRYFLTSSPSVKAEDMNFSEKGLEEVIKKHFNRLYNVLSLYDLYKNKVINIHAHTSSANPLDVWVKGLLYKTRDEITSHLDKYELDKATKLIGDFIENLSIWYIRRSRERFKNDENELDMDRALSTTKYVLLEFSKLMAPFIPFIAEDIYLKLKDKNDEESVHLCSWPSYEISAEQKNLTDLILSQMEEVRKAVTLGLEVRAKANIKVRQPLSRLMLREDNAGISDNEEMITLIKDEVNVKEVIFDANISELAELDTEITEELRKEGIARDVIRTIQELRKEKNLSPGDMIQVVVRSTTDIHHIVSEYKETISKTASVSDFLFEESHLLPTKEGGQAGEPNFTIRIV